MCVTEQDKKNNSLFESECFYIHLLYIIHIVII